MFLARKFWIGCIGAALLLGLGPAPLLADPRSGLQYLPGPGSLPEGVQVTGQQENHGPGGRVALITSGRFYAYPYGGDLRQSGEQHKYIEVRLILEYHEQDPALLRQGRSNDKVPPEIRDRYPAVFYYYEGGDSIHAGALKGHYAYEVWVIFMEGKSKISPAVAQEGRYLFNWGLERLSRELPGEAVSLSPATRSPGPSAAPAPPASPSPSAERVRLLKEYEAMKAKHAELLETRTQLVAYESQVIKIFHYNTAKMTVSLVVNWLSPPKSLGALAFKIVKDRLDQAGLTSRLQSDASKMEIQRRLLLLSAMIGQAAQGCLDQAKDLRARMSLIQQALEAVPK